MDFHAVKIIIWFAGKAQTCYTTSDCSDGGSSSSSYEHCCLQSGTMAYNDGTTCKPCIGESTWSVCTIPVRRIVRFYINYLQNQYIHTDSHTYIHTLFSDTAAGIH